MYSEIFMQFQYLLFVLIFVVFQSSTLKGQPLVQEGNSWNVAIFAGVSSPVNTSYSVRIYGDTLIDSKSYKILEYRNPMDENSNWTKSLDFVRQEEQKVYFKRLNNEEILIYDFGLAKDDEIKLFGDCSYRVTEIDSVYTVSNTKPRKRIKLSRQGFIEGEQEWIEGIGSNLGTFTHQNHCYFDYAEALLCFYRENVLDYPVNPTSCRLDGTSNTNTSERRITLAPQPAEETLSVLGYERGIISYTIICSQGRELKHGEIVPGETDIDVHNLRKGIYHLVLRSASGNTYYTWIKS